MGLNSVIITLVALGAVAWLAVLVTSSSRKRKKEEVPANLSVFATDDELESSRLDRVLAAAVIVSAFMALALPIYYLGESDRQEGFVEEFAETDVEHGHEVWEEFGCAGCHGVDGGGGAAPYLEVRSQINVAGWAAPAVNDVFYRYDDDEVRFWLVYGRANSPMPAWGLEGGGPLNTQQIDDLMIYLKSIQVSQDEALLKIQPQSDAAIDRIATGDAAVETAIADQMQLIEDIDAAGALAPIAAELAEEAAEVLEGAESGLDTDGDGLSDRTETRLNRISERAVDEGVLASGITLDPLNAETTVGQSDASVAAGFVSNLESTASSLQVTADNRDALIEQAEFGLAFLETSADERRWDVDYESLAGATFDGDVAAAERAVGVFNAYCARCHTAGYSAGVPFQEPQASGALGPSLRDGRANVQFLTETDMVEFLIRGSENGVGYGVNGVGSGRMPGFGAVLSAEDIDLIVKYLRGTTLDGIVFAEGDAGA